MVIDLFFQSRRGPAAGLYLFLGVCVFAMLGALSPPTNRVSWADAKSELAQGDEIVRLAGRDIRGWADVRAAVACYAPPCEGSAWDAKECVCSRRALADPSVVASTGTQILKAGPALPASPFFLGVIVFLMSLCVIGTHGLLSGTATIDFGGRRAAATAGGLIDGCVYLGMGLQSPCLGWLTTKSWSYWPPFLLPFAVVGFVLCTRIWHAKPGLGEGRGGPRPK